MIIKCHNCCLFVPILQTPEEKKEAATNSAVASRFAYDVLSQEDEAVKASRVKRGKDGHIALGSSHDFFSDPMGSSADKPPASSRSKWAPMLFTCSYSVMKGIAWLEIAESVGK